MAQAGFWAVSSGKISFRRDGRWYSDDELINNARIAELIRENQPEDVHEAIAEGAFFHMQTFSQSLIELVLSGDIDRDVAADASSNKHDFLVSLEHALKRMGADEREEEQRVEAEENPEPELRLIAPAEG